MKIKCIKCKSHAVLVSRHTLAIRICDDCYHIWFPENDISIKCSSEKCENDSSEFSSFCDTHRGVIAGI